MQIHEQLTQNFQTSPVVPTDALWEEHAFGGGREIHPKLQPTIDLLRQVGGCSDLCEMLSMKHIGKWNNHKNGPDGAYPTLFGQGPLLNLLENKNQYFMGTPLNGGASWNLLVGKERERRHQELTDKFDVSPGFLGQTAVFGSYTEDFRCVALISVYMPESGLIDYLHNKIDVSKGDAIKTTYTAIEDPDSINASWIEHYDGELAQQYLSPGYRKHIERLQDHIMSR